MTTEPEARSQSGRPGLVRNWHWMTLSGFLMALAGLVGFAYTLGSGDGEWAMLLMAVGVLLMILGIASKVYGVIARH